MKITWNKNPLLTTVEPDESEIEVLRLKLRIQELEERMFSAHWELSRIGDTVRGKVRTTESAMTEAKRLLDPDYVYSEGEHENGGLDARVQMLVTCYLEELKEQHIGDCVCVACSCIKCHAETMFGLDTIKGLGKHAARKVWGAFGKDNERSFDEALETLKTTDHAVYVWLQEYGQAHPEVTGSPEPVQS